MNMIIRVSNQIHTLFDILQDLNIKKVRENIVTYFINTIKSDCPVRESYFIIYNQILEKYILENNKINLDAIKPLLNESLKNKKVIIKEEQLIIPLIYCDKVLAMLFIISSDRISLRKALIKDIELYTKICGLIYYNAYMYNMAIKDPLTNTFNIRYFKYKLFEYFHNYKQINEKFSIILLDIDYFKHYNDKYGHQIGDMILQHLSTAINNIIDDDIIFARYGGEEFILLLPKYNRDSTIKFADRLRKSIKRIKISTKDYFWKITVSLGTSSFPDDANNPYDLIDFADISLYYSKKNGRDKVSNYYYDVKKT